MTADIHFYFDPVCPFAWMTSKWVRMVQAQRDHSVEWRPISLRLINAHLDYDTHFPEGYDAGHTAGLRLLRVAGAARESHGPEAVGRFYEAIGARIFDTDKLHDLVGEDGLDRRGTAAFVVPALAAAELPAELAEALDDTGRDGEIQASSDEALALTGKDVGTPIIHFRPPAGVAFFGPVISRLPEPERAAELWDHVVGLATFPGFAELKRSLRERPQLRAFGVDPEQTGAVEDWHAGSRRLKK
ncbi:DsbA family protein [Nocardioides insulae]|uniref:mycothiol-dependent nitroreductase Rv2466c family protein n=1 Tax=Nocardioides insulae TaxID=394734 RepID=UPI0003FDADE0|nr:DsbA family protein [Nocardioides insulae]